MSNNASEEVCTNSISKSDEPSTKEMHAYNNNTTQKKKKKFKCKICKNITFTLEDDFLYHIKNEHNGKLNDYFICSECGKQFKHKSELVHHNKSKCGTIKRFKCEICGAELMSAGSFYNHKQIHSGEKKHMCRFCAKQFLTFSQMQKHERSHTQEKLYSCSVCGKAFVHRQSLITHSTLHTGIRPYHCENCDRTFSCLGNLLKHRRAHADTCGSILLTNHRVQNPITKIKIQMNTPETKTSRMTKKEKEIFEKLQTLGEKKTNEQISFNLNDSVDLPKEHFVSTEAINTYEVHNHKNFVNNQHIHIESLNCKGSTNENIESSKINQENLCKIDHLLDISGSSERNEILIEEKKDSNIELNPQIQVTILDNCTGNKSCLKEDPKKICEKSSMKLKKKYIKNTVHANKKVLKIFALERGFQDKNSRVPCKYCAKIYSIASRLFSHEKEHEVVKEQLGLDQVRGNIFKCLCCKMPFATKEDRNQHQQEEHLDSLTCTNCNKVFARPESVKVHTDLAHKGISRKQYLYVCDKCGEQFNQKSKVKQHKENHCGPPPLVVCPVCKKGFSSSHTMKNHMVIHDEQKKLKCRFCPKMFHWKGQLKVHERSHTGERPFNCNVCSKSFAYRDSLITHSTLHSGIRPHVCKECGLRFSCIGNLRKHSKVHENKLILNENSD